jgi:predicted nuclease of predicted toxin-antitoxin system
VRFLVDENLSPLLAVGLNDAGHDAAHVRDIGLTSAADSVILDRARADGRVLVSADTDFGSLLAASGDNAPSIILVRRSSERRAARVLGLVLANLDQVADVLVEGAIVVLENDRVRVRRLPLP